MYALTINAWLERREPVVSLHSAISGNLIAEWRGEAVQELLEQGIVNCTELSSASRRIQQQTAHELLLIACANSLCSRNGPQCFSCITGRLLRALAQSDSYSEQPSIAGFTNLRTAC